MGGAEVDGAAGSKISSRQIVRPVLDSRGLSTDMSAALKLPPAPAPVFIKHTPPRLTEEEYEDILAKSDVKLEFLNGQIHAMAGGGASHSLVKSNTIARLNDAFRKRPCRVYDSDMKVKAEASGMNSFPDASIVCGKPEFKDDKRLTLLNPGVIVEVLSPGTEAFDRGMKFLNYREIPSLHTYVLISTEEPLVEVYELNADAHWQLETFRGADSTVRLHHCEVEIPLADFYEKTEFDPAWVEAGEA